MVSLAGPVSSGGGAATNEKGHTSSQPDCPSVGEKAIQKEPHRALADESSNMNSQPAPMGSDSGGIGESGRAEASWILNATGFAGYYKDCSRNQTLQMQRAAN